MGNHSTSVSFFKFIALVCQPELEMTPGLESYIPNFENKKFFLIFSNKKKKA